ncbi:uncharacterized protein LACBIDRAFT_324421 [Laccaria bicolor S238N-H82]|uniref:Predicted protein n=1 Tax=Laccaria bicolor (strain S238N-H82 / ATCC MYA-4686) TaxID=486041 RepID=B0D1S3_LACBS|nr:uncharacterized protein LACBIDRAFT_324421 [Laccaria bicolor S238N-H82]EDR11690.1 predicted protein [Laccaria bicolor S238N-H82]|eukprot:XP_001877587.1 predicted protein [Laccaria bicolor S238N-H82]
MANYQSFLLAGTGTCKCVIALEKDRKGLGSNRGRLVVGQKNKHGTHRTWSLSKLHFLINTPRSLVALLRPVTVLYPTCCRTQVEPASCGETASPFILVGVKHNTLVGQAGLDAALARQSILVENGSGMSSSFVFNSKSLYKPTITANSVFTEENDLFTFREEKPKKVLFMEKAAFESCCNTAIIGQHLTINYLNRRLEAAQKMEDEEEAKMKKADIANQMAWQTKGIEVYQKFLINVTRDWKDKRNCIIGHVILSPLICFDYGDECFLMTGPSLKFIPL